MISHEHRCIFIHVPKCAGQSIETAFLQDVGLSWETRAVLLLRQNDQPQIGPPRLAHLVARDYVRLHHISNDLFEEYFKFSVVRNPWARVVSLYRYLDVNESFHDFVHLRLERSLTAGHLNPDFWFLRPQIDYVSDDSGKIIVDEILRLENLDVEFGRVAEKVGLNYNLGHVNKSDPADRRFASITPSLIASGHVADRIRRRLARVRRSIGSLNSRSTGAGWRDFYDSETREKVGILYARDAEAFDYKFEAE